MRSQRPGGNAGSGRGKRQAAVPDTPWPAMRGNRAVAADDPLDPVLAGKPGVVVGTSHLEPMMRAHAEWKRFGKGPRDYTRSAKELQAFRHGGDDKPMARDTQASLLERTIADLGPPESVRCRKPSPAQPAPARKTPTEPCADRTATRPA